MIDPKQKINELSKKLFALQSLVYTLITVFGTLIIVFGLLVVRSAMSIDDIHHKLQKISENNNTSFISLTEKNGYYKECQEWVTVTKIDMDYYLENCCSDNGQPYGLACFSVNSGDEWDSLSVEGGNTVRLDRCTKELITTTKTVCKKTFLVKSQ